MSARFDESWAALRDAVRVRRVALGIVSLVRPKSAVLFPPYAEHEIVVREPCCNGNDG
jgi:hypothetical protein